MPPVFYDFFLSFDFLFEVFFQNLTINPLQFLSLLSNLLIEIRVLRTMTQPLSIQQ